MTATNYDVTDSYAKYAPDASQMRNARGNVFTSANARTIYSYGTHFPMAHVMPDASGNPRGWWLVNGDRYSNTTSKHQSGLRSALERTGLPVLIVPFSALEQAGIDWRTITPVEVRPDEWTTRSVRGEPADMPAYVYDYRELADGRREWDVREHHLGASVFSADYRSGWTEGNEPLMITAQFLSAFDEQEGHGLYFLAELPENYPDVTSVAEAFERLRPAEVLAADAAGVPVTRQGDVFAIATDLKTRELAGETQRGAYVLGVNHTATEVREHFGHTYARGTLRHRPRESWRRPEHRMQTMSDGKTWHKIVKNTVPAGRSWSVDGRVD